MKDPVTHKFNEYLFCGPRPESLSQMRHFDFRLIVDLQSGVQDKLSQDAYERQRLNPATFDLSVMYLKCSNIFPPTHGQVLQFLAIAASAFPDKRKTYFHCMSGVDRTGFMRAVYQMQVDNWPLEYAMAEFQAFRHPWFFWWDLFLAKWEKF